MSHTANNEIRELNAAELDEVNGGVLPALAAAAGFLLGFNIGCIIANYKMTGNFWGDIE